MGSATQPPETIFTLTGCTAVGKTALALDWAEENDAEIVSCDSLLFYRGMDVGTAKPTAQERQRVPHHLIDIRSPGDPMDIAEYVELAIQAVTEVRDRGRKVLATGGSGFYLKAFFEPVTDGIAISSETKRQVEAISVQSGLEGMLAALREIDPECDSQVDTRNPRRVLKALERCMETGKPLRHLKTEFARRENPLTTAPKKLAILERDRDDLDDRIRRRAERMLENGLVDEVERLKRAGLESNPSAANAIGYRETLSYLDGEYDYSQLVERIALNTRRLAKKQRTWFRTQLPEGKRIDLSGGGAFPVSELFA